jgi:hypothetical protein
LTWRSIIGVCPNANVGTTNKKQTDVSVGHFIGSTPDALTQNICLVWRRRV